MVTATADELVTQIDSSYSYVFPTASALTLGDTNNYIYFVTEETSDVSSIDSGVVTYVGYDFSFGRYVAVDGDDGTKLIYCHLSETSIVKGDTLASGDVLGKSGSTGQAKALCAGLLSYDVDGNSISIADRFVAQ